MNEAGEDHPAGLAVLAEVLGGLEQVLQLRHVGVGVAVVDQLIQIFGRLPDAHLHPVQAEILLPLGHAELVGLEGVVEAVELADRRAGVGLIIPELVLLLVRRIADLGLGLGGRLAGIGIARFVEVLDLVEAVEWRGGIGTGGGAHGTWTGCDVNA